MDDGDVACDEVIAELVGMGFDFSDITEAVESVGPSLDSAIEFLLNGSHRNNGVASSDPVGLTNNKVLGERPASSLHYSSKMRQKSITEHLNLAPTCKKSKGRDPHNASISTNSCPESLVVPSYCTNEEITGIDWEKKVKNLLCKHFGYSSLKEFQKEVLGAWLANQDCLVLAATGSGKSLCFQIPALLSGKVVVVISPLISLMHDQCLKLGKHGISACFLGSGQIDKSVEQKAMSGAYSIIYVCPETILRLIKPLQSLAESRGIALFAIDEVHCVSKWGHDFRPAYRRLSVLRDNFSAENLKFLKFDIPLMALTATATIRVREDILKSLCMSTGTKVVTTSFFRPNLRFSVKHSRTSSLASYEKDLSELIKSYTKKKKPFQDLISPDFEKCAKTTTSGGRTFRPDEMRKNKVHDVDDCDFSDDDGVSGKYGVGLPMEDHLASSPDEEKLSIQFLEDDFDLVQETDDLDVSCGAFCETPDSQNLLKKAEQKPTLHQGPLEGPTIIYVRTRKETLSLAKFLSRFGVKAAAYNAKLPKTHLRQVHKEFHEDVLQVVVATIAFGMGIDKSNVRRVIHYGWPQSLEAYYQEAGRAGRDGKLADCVLYANLSRMPTLLPSQRTAEQTKQAYKMLSDCFRYGMKSSWCRAKMLVEYFGEGFTQERCLLCDVCIDGPPEIQDLKTEAKILLQLIAAHYGDESCQDPYCDDESNYSLKPMRLSEKPKLRAFVGTIRAENHTFAASDFLWWRGLARLLEDRGLIVEGDEMASETVYLSSHIRKAKKHQTPQPIAQSRVQIRFPEPTSEGLQFLNSELEEPFYVYPEADMLLSKQSCKSYSGFAEWGKGWADPEIRRQRLERKKTSRKPSKRKPRKPKHNMSTVRGRLSAKLQK